MSVSPLTDEKLAFWRRRGALAEKYYQLSAVLERQEAYEDAARAYWDSYQINQNELAQKKLGLLKPQAIHAGAPLVVNSDLPIEAENCFYLGLQYLGGLGHSQNDAQAVACFKSAAEKGYAPAQITLGWTYAEGRGMPRDDAQAVNWYRQAAGQGHAGAQTNLGVRYANGRGVPRDDAQAVNLYRRAAKQGHAGAQTNLGVCYKTGQGVVRRDYTQAANWFRQAAKQGHVIAQCNLGLFYEKGRGLPQNDTKAIKWYRRAVKQGDADAQNYLEQLYEHHRGPIEAGSAEEYRREYKNGIKNALSMLKICKDRLGDFESRYHYAVASYSPLKDKIIGDYLSDLIKNEPKNEILDAVINDDLLSLSEREVFVQKIFEAHRRDKGPSGSVGFFQPASTSQLSDENYGWLCYVFGSELYETAELRKYPAKIEKAKAYYKEVPKTSTFYRKAMSELFDLEAIKITETNNSTEARSDKLWVFHNIFFQEKDIEKGHQVLDAYYDSEIYRQSPEYLEGEKFTQDLRERNSNFKDIQDKNIIALANKIR